MSEWKAFGSFAEDYLGMPADAMPFYNSKQMPHGSQWHMKAERIMAFILETGSFGHNRDVSYQKETSKTLRRLITLWRQTLDNAEQFMIFPKNSIKVWWSFLMAGIKNVVNGK